MSQVIILNSRFDAFDDSLLKQLACLGLLNEWCLFHLTFEGELKWPQIRTVDQLRAFCSQHFIPLVLGKAIYLQQIQKREGVFARYVDICTVFAVLGTDQAWANALTESDLTLIDPHGTHEMGNWSLHWRDTDECIESHGYRLFPLVELREHSRENAIAICRLSGLSVTSELQELVKLSSTELLSTEQALFKLGAQKEASAEFDRTHRLQQAVWKIAEKLGKVLGIVKQDLERLLLVPRGTDLMPAHLESYIQLSYLLKIYKALHRIFPNKVQANTWLHRANDRFDGKSALAYVLNDPVDALEELSAYLAAQFS